VETNPTGGTARGLYGHSDLDRLINPKVIAVVGASPAPGSFGQRTLENLADFGGSVYGINPKYDEVLGRACFGSLKDLPEAPDAVILGVAQRFVAPTLQDAVDVGAGGAIIYASGYAETGHPESVQLQDELTEFAQRTALRIAGPNCVGLANLRTRAVMNFMTDSGKITRGRVGGIGIVSQSGALGYTVLQGVHRGVGFSHYLAAGNSSDVDVCDYVAYLAEDPAATAIVCLMEGVKSGERFLEAARRARDTNTPLIVYKAGNTATSGKAALSHTGTLTGSTAAYRAAVEEAGAIWVEDLETVVETASFFAKNPRGPRTGGVGIMSTSGGAGVINADKAEENGLTLPPLAEATASALSEIVPDFGSVANPADLTAEVLKDPETFVRCLDAFTTDPGFGVVVVPLVFAHELTTGARAGVLGRVAQTAEVPLVATWMNDWLEGPGSSVLDSDPKVSIFRSAGRAMRTIRQWHDWHARKDASLAAPADRVSPPAAEQLARAVIDGATTAEGADGVRVLTEHDSKAVLAAYGIRVPGAETVVTPEEAVAVAESLGYPVVVKIASADIPHKTEVGGIRLGLASAAAVEEAAREILETVPPKAPGAVIEGVSVQSQIPTGPELLLGARGDLQFGPLVTVGAGGILVEVLRDAAVRLPPISPAQARETLAGLRSYALLEGVRGDAGYDIGAVADVFARFSELVTDLADVIEEIDVNPLIAGRTGCTAADALIVVRASLAGTADAAAPDGDRVAVLAHEPA